MRPAKGQSARDLLGLWRMGSCSKWWVGCLNCGNSDVHVRIGYKCKCQHLAMQACWLLVPCMHDLCLRSVQTVQHSVGDGSWHCVLCLYGTVAYIVAILLPAGLQKVERTPAELEQTDAGSMCTLWEEVYGHLPNVK